MRASSRGKVNSNQEIFLPANRACYLSGGLREFLSSRLFFPRFFSGLSNKSAFCRGASPVNR